MTEDERPTTEKDNPPSTILRPPSAKGIPMKTLRPFFALWTGQAVSLLGSRLVQFALIWHLAEQTGSATVLATATMVGFLPTILLGPFVGILIDRWPRKWVMAGADAVVAGATIILALLFATEQATIGHIYLILFIRALGNTFHGPAMTATTSLMVPPEQLTRIAGINQMLQGGLSIIAAPLGALLIAILPMSNILAIDIVTFLFAIAPLLVVTVPEPEIDPAGQTTLTLQTFRTDLTFGFRYIWNWKGLRALIATVIILNFLFAPLSALLPILITEHFNGGALQLGWLSAAFGTGTLLGGLLLSLWGGFKKRIYTTLVGFLLLGLTSFALGLVPANLFWVALTIGLLLGLAIPITNGPMIAIMQGTIDPKVQGRVFTLLSSLSTGMTPIGLAIAGPTADAFGVQTWYIIAGIVCVMLGLHGFFNQALLTLGETDKPTSPI